MACVPEFLKTHSLFLGEDATSFMRSKGIGEPPDPNCWGNSFLWCIAKSPFVIKTGKVKNAKADGAHSRSVKLWKSILCQDEDRLSTVSDELQAIRARFLLREITLNQALREAAEVGASALS